MFMVKENMITSTVLLKVAGKRTNKQTKKSLTIESEFNDSEQMSLGIWAKDHVLSDS